MKFTNDYQMQISMVSEFRYFCHIKQRNPAQRNARWKPVVFDVGVTPADAMMKAAEKLRALELDIENVR